jgi:nitrite reductase (NADH) small subunit
MAETTKVAELSALTEQRTLAVKVGDKQVALFLVDGTVLATAGRCPHAAGFLHKGTVAEGKVSCPWHGWNWNLTTGACDESDELTLERYPVHVEGNDIYVVL